ncbi:urease accessory protein UreD [Actinokineospora pegani]|uniref:urease accessory protein UreD n=1 Tax=Actinokineospora pegani TaxID=2654637 RepID=UPI0012E9E488|nr:urease accessory protein UreD [Actinokineospora pegani]
MRSVAIVSAERAADGRTAIRELRSESPTRLIPRRPAVPSRDGSATVRMVASAAGPLGGDLLELRVRVGAGAHLRLVGTGATLALPGPGGEPSRATVRIEVEPGGVLEYLPDETIVCAGADHHTELRADLAAGSRLRTREVLVLGRHAEDPGRLTTATHVVLSGSPLLRQTLDLTDPRLLASPGHLVGAKVLATELVVGDEDPATASTGPWWSLTPLAGGGTLATALADDPATATARLAAALGDHASREPGAAPPAPLPASA